MIRGITERSSSARFFLNVTYKDSNRCIVSLFCFIGNRSIVYKSKNIEQKLINRIIKRKQGYLLRIRFKLRDICRYKLLKLVHRFFPSHTIHISQRNSEIDPGIQRDFLTTSSRILRDFLNCFTNLQSIPKLAVRFFESHSHSLSLQSELLKLLKPPPL